MSQMQPRACAIRIRQPGVIDLPPRTRLYHLVPISMETIWCESLTGYINRLGWAHRISPRILVSEIINPQLPEPLKAVATFCPQLAMRLNGNGEQANVWGEVVGQLTGHADLRCLTLSPFVGDFPVRLLRSTPSWCPSCLAEWRSTSQPLYQPLLWMVQLVTLCPVHRIPLVDRCPECHKHQRVVAAHKTQPFECTSCTCWLGEEPGPYAGDSDTAELIPWQVWIISTLEELRAASLQVGILPWKAFFTQISSYLKERKAYAKLASAMGTDRSYLHRWVTTQEVMLETLFKFCYQCEITPWQVMNGKLDPLERIIHEGTCKSAPRPPYPTRRVDQENCLRQLRTALSENAAPPSLRQVARELGHASTIRLTKHFPEECALVAQRHVEYRAQRKEQRLLKICEDIRQVVFSLYAQGEYPLIYKLSPFFPNGLMRQREAIEAWRSALQELGLEP